MKNKLLVCAAFSALLAGLSGCTALPDRTWARCNLLEIAFRETDELAPGWYAEALQEMQACGMRHYTQDAATGRGKQ